MDERIGTTDGEIRESVKERYGAVAREGRSCCAPSCCSPGGAEDQARETARAIGYSEGELDAVPEGANLGLGCGNPTALASLRPGEVVVDLGAGAGFDALLAAREVGPEGRVIGVDMTPEMLARARRNAVRMGVEATVEFREGIIEALPVASASADVVISNCVINLSPDKGAAFAEAFRVLRPGGRLAVSDILLSEPLPADLAEMATVYAACVGGALVADEYLAGLRAAGFERLEVDRTPGAAFLLGSIGDPTVAAVVGAIGRERVERVAGTVFSYKITAWKPSAPSATS